MATNEPMTDEQLEEIDELLHNNEEVPSDLVRLLADEVERLRADNALLETTINGTESYCDRLRAENAAMRPIVVAVASAVVMTRGDMPSVIKRAIMFTPERSIKKLQEEARAFVASAGQEE